MGLTHANFVLLQGSPTWSHSCLEYYPGESVWVLAEVDNALRPQGVRVRASSSKRGSLLCEQSVCFSLYHNFSGRREEEKKKGAARERGKERPL